MQEACVNCMQCVFQHATALQHAVLGLSHGTLAVYKAEAHVRAVCHLSASGGHAREREGERQRRQSSPHCLSCQSQAMIDVMVHDDAAENRLVVRMATKAAEEDGRVVVSMKCLSHQVHLISATLLEMLDANKKLAVSLMYPLQVAVAVALCLCAPTF